MEIVGHGGAGDFFPGNSETSLRKAIALGVDRIEVDVQRSADGALVLCHDKELEIDGQKRPVSELPLTVIRDALDGLLTLDQAIELTRTTAPLMIDMKVHGYERPIADAIERHGIAGDTIVSSTWAVSLRKVRQHAPGVQLALSTGHLSTGIGHVLMNRTFSTLLSAGSIVPSITVAKAIGADLLSINHRICSGLFVEAAHTAGLQVYPWTVNHPGRIRQMLERGVDGIISNRPDLVAEQVEVNRRD